MVSTGNILPSLSINGARRASQMAVASMVADMMMIFKSGRMISCACRVRASARSELMLRS